MVLGMATFSCAENTPAPVTPKTAEAPPPLPEPSALPKGHVWRYQVMEELSPGLGAFLQRLDVKEKMVDGRFYGFQIVALTGDPDFWQGTDLRAGDVITSVNASPIGHYDEAFRVWQSLATAPQIVVAYERGTEQREIRIIIHEDDDSASKAPPADTGKSSAQPTPSASVAPAVSSAPSPSKQP